MSINTLLLDFKEYCSINLKHENIQNKLEEGRCRITEFINYFQMTLIFFFLLYADYYLFSQLFEDFSSDEKFGFFMAGFILSILSLFYFLFFYLEQIKIYFNTRNYNNRNILSVIIIYIQTLEDSKEKNRLISHLTVYSNLQALNQVIEQMNSYEYDVFLDMLNNDKRFVDDIKNKNSEKNKTLITN